MAKTDIKTETGIPVFLRDEACKRCGCFEAFEFGPMRVNACYGCGALGAKAEPSPTGHPSCTAGRVEHRHDNR